MTITAPSFPLAPPEYDQSEERAFRARVSDEIDKRLGQYQVPVFGGIPHAAVTGTDTAFSTPGGGVITILPFNVVEAFNPDLMLGTNFRFAYKMDIGWWLQLQHIDGAGGNTSFTLYIYRDGIVVRSVTEDIALGNDDSFNRMFFTQIVSPGGVLDFRVSHTSAQAMIFDMTRSQVWVEQLTPNPRIVGLERL